MVNYALSSSISIFHQEVVDVGVLVCAGPGTLHGPAFELRLLEVTKNDNEGIKHYASHHSSIHCDGQKQVSLRMNAL